MNIHNRVCVYIELRRKGNNKNKKTEKRYNQSRVFDCIRPLKIQHLLLNFGLVQLKNIRFCSKSWMVGLHSDFVVSQCSELLRFGPPNLHL